MIKRLLLIVLVLAMVGGAVYALKLRKAEELAGMSQRVVPPAAVSVVEVRQVRWRQSLFAVGSVAAEMGINVNAPLPGTVVSIHFESGQKIKRGDVLIAQDVGVQMAELDGLIASQALRELQFERSKKLLKDRQISQSDFDAARAALDEAKALAEAKRAYIVRKKVYAPFDGTLGIRMVDLGTYLEPGDPIVPLHMLDPIHVDYAVPEQFLSRLAVGQEIEIAVPAYPGEKFFGQITAFDPDIDRATRNVRIRATFSNPDRRLRPGMFAEVTTLDGELRSVSSLPQTAVTYSPYGDAVFAVVSNGGETVVERRQIETGEVRHGRVEIVSGIAVGSRVVAAGQNKLRNGMLVNVTETINNSAGTDAVAP
jgi:membrane fusion protein, multidrug efflux system